jgi:hypothetical protein
LAERTVANEDKELGPLVSEAAAKLRRQFEAGSPEVEATRQALESNCLRVLGKRVSSASPSETLSGLEDLAR